MDENRFPATGMETSTLPNMSAKVYPVKDPKQEKGSILAFASVDLGGCFAVTGIKIISVKIIMTTEEKYGILAAWKS